MAEGFAKHYSDDIQATSAGTSPASKISKKAVKVMSEKGIDISQQKPSLINPSEVKDVDLIITMGCGPDACPTAPPEKVREWKIDDPCGRSIEDFRKIRDKIENKVRELIKEIRSD